jgi:hypothetical protein
MPNPLSSLQTCLNNFSAFARTHFSGFVCNTTCATE